MALYLLESASLTRSALAKSHPVEGGEKRLDDGGGLKLIVNPKGNEGGDRWAFASTVAGKRFEMGLGTLEKVSLAAARVKADAARALVGQGIDPRTVKEQTKTAAALAAEDAMRARHNQPGRESFRRFAEEFAEKKFAGDLAAIAETEDGGKKKKQSRWTQKTFNNFAIRMGANVYPITGADGCEFGNKNVGAITTEDVYQVLRACEARGALAEMAAVRKAIEPIFASLKRRKLIAENPLDFLITDDFDEHVAGNNPAVETAEQLRAVLQAFAVFRTTGRNAKDAIIMRTAIDAQVRLFQRSFVIVSMQWKWVDLDGTNGKRGEGPMIRIPFSEMKGNKKARSRKGAHEVPLAPQSVAAFRALYAVTGAGVYCFPSATRADGHMNETSLNNAMQNAMGRRRVDGKWLPWEAYQTCHGFRAVALTLGADYIGLDENVINSIQAHAAGDKALGKAYKRNEYLHLRRDAMERYSNWLDAVLAGKVHALTLPTVALSEATRNRLDADRLRDLESSGRLARALALLAAEEAAGQAVALAMAPGAPAANDRRAQAA